MKWSKFKSDDSHLTYISKEDHWRGDWRLLPVLLPVFYIALALSAHSDRSLETLQNTLRYKDRKRRLVLENDRSAVLFLRIDGWKQEDIFL